MLLGSIKDGWRKEIQSTSWVSSAAQSPVKEFSEIKTTEVRIAELPPEVIAPHIKKPPKSSGFGEVGSSNRD